MESPTAAFGKSPKVNKVIVRLGHESEGLISATMDVFAVLDGEAKWLGCTKLLSDALGMAVKNGCGSYVVFTRQTQRKDYYDVVLIDGESIPTRTSSTI